MMSMSTTSASSLEAIQWAAVAPTFPDPTTVTFLRMDILSLNNRKSLPQGAQRTQGNPLLRRCRYRCAHVFDYVAGKFAGFYFGRAFHQALEVVGHFLLLDSAFQRLLD